MVDTGQPARVLVVDDDSFNFVIFEFVLTKLKIECDYFTTGQDALD